MLFCSLSGGAIAGIAIAVFFALVLGGVCGFFIYRVLAMKQVGSVKIQANKLMEDAQAEAKTLRKESLIEAKEEQLKMRNEVERETKERRAEMQKAEARIVYREEMLNKKEANIDKKNDSIDALKKNLELKEEQLNYMDNEVKQAHNKMLLELEKVSGLSCDEAKTILMDNLLESVKKDAAIKAKEIEATATDEAKKRAKNIVGLAIQRCATDHAAEITVSVVQLPNDEMKGRLIGRVGRNIRAIENSTGVDLIIDDTPDIVTVSGFDPVRREIARLSIEKLVADGRIHPARIEEMVEKVRIEMEMKIKEYGDAAAFDAGVYGIHPELIKLLGRLKYRTSYGQNVLNHSLEVCYLAGMMASELGADVKIAKRAGLLHDIGKAVDHEVEGTHIQIGVDLAKKYKESKEVMHCIEAHHGDVEAKTLEAILVQAADAISGSRPGARRESIENYVKRLEKLEAIANSFEGVEQSYAIQAGREIRVIVKPEVVDDGASIFMAKEIAQKLESELEYPGQIKVNVIRELRSVEYAK
ncbi:MAG: ribonuclease Y [Clostridia bacterium]